MSSIHTKIKDREARSLRNSINSMRWHGIGFYSSLFLLLKTMSNTKHTTTTIAKISSNAGEAEALHALQMINEFKTLWHPEDMEPMLWSMLLNSMASDTSGLTGNERAGQMFLYQKLNGLAKALQCVTFETQIN
jgi:hypothetical protein